MIEDHPTTMLIVEILVGGMLILLALGFLVVSILPGAVRVILDGTQALFGLEIGPDQSIPGPILLLLSTLFVALAYSVGVLSEPIAREIFEKDLDEIKKRRIREFLKKNPDLKESPVLKNPATRSYGYMRFYVMKESPGLHQDVASQLHRFRLLRLTYLAVIISCLAALLTLCREFSVSLTGLFWICVLVILYAIVCVSITKIIHDRFDRYCRSVERSYRLLIYQQYHDLADISSQTSHMTRIKTRSTRIGHQLYRNPLVGVVVCLFKDSFQFKDIFLYRDISLFKSVFLSKDKRLAVFKEDDVWKLPERHAHGDEYLEDTVYRVLSDYLSDSEDITIKSYTLFSCRNFRENIYQYDYVARVSMGKSKIKPLEIKWASILIPRLLKCFLRFIPGEIKWVSPSNFKNIEIYPPHRKLLEEYFNLPHSEAEAIVPEDPPTSLKCKKDGLKKTRKIHAECARDFPMPSITVDGILLKFSQDCEFEGIILERRSEKVDREPGKWAFPGGFVEAHETVPRALIREVKQETGITLDKSQFLSVHRFGTGPERDPRYFVWTQFLVFYTMEEPKINQKSEIDDVRVFSLKEIPWDKMAFDHGDILEEVMNYLPHHIDKAEEYCVGKRQIPDKG